MSPENYEAWVGLPIVWEHGDNRLFGIAEAFHEDDSKFSISPDGVRPWRYWVPAEGCTLRDLWQIDNSVDNKAAAWTQGWIACDDYRDSWVQPEMPANPYRNAGKQDTHEAHCVSRTGRGIREGVCDCGRVDL